MSKIQGIFSKGKQIGYARFDFDLPIPRVSVFTMGHKRIGSASTLNAAKKILADHLETANPPTQSD